MRFKPVLWLCAVGVFALAGCSKPEASASSSSPAPSTVSASPATEMASPTSGYPQLLGVVTNTKAAVEAKDFAKAQQEFDKFEGVWSQVEDGIKAKSSQTYDGIEQDMDNIKSALKASEADQSLTALQSLNDHVQSAP